MCLPHAFLTAGWVRPAHSRFIRKRSPPGLTHPAVERWASDSTQSVGTRSRACLKILVLYYCDKQPVCALLNNNTLEDFCP
jgi:hypothetical protein